MAAQTERIRIGHGAVVCVPEMNHPIRVAERCATLDIISGGRLEVGTARSSTWTELGGFNVDPDDTKKTWDEFVRALPKLWADGHVSWEGSCLLDAGTQRAAEAGAEAPPADVGDGHQPGHRARRRRPRSRLPRRRRRGLRRAGTPHRGVLPPHRAVRPRRRHGDARGHHAELPVLSRRPRHGGRGGHGHGRRLRARQLAPAVDARGVPHSCVPVARQPRTRRRSRAASGGPGDAYGIPEGICVGDPDIIGAAIEALGVGRRHRHQLPVERARVDPAAAGARQHAALRRRGHAAVPRAR